MTTPPAEPGLRLNGWKEIAAHLGKGTRTAQRWEKEYGLPVHRVGREGGEIVFAFAEEVDRWSRNYAVPRLGAERRPEAEEDDRAPRPRVGAIGQAGSAWHRRQRLAFGALALVTAAATIGALWHRWSSRDTERRPLALEAPRRQPTTWRLAGDSLTVFDESDAPLFVHRFGFRLNGAPIGSASPPADLGPRRVVIEDVDGDGRSEILAMANAEDRANRKLFCFEADGRLRFVHQPTGARRFGEDEYADPWLAHGVFVTRGPGGPRLWAVFTHNLLFPCVLQELAPRDGSVRQEYWSDGYIEVVREETWAGRRVLLVGGANNDFRAAMLAVFRPETVAGSTPAVRPAYACRNCSPGGPEAVFLFPTLCVNRRAGQAGVYDVWGEKGENLRVSVAQGGATPGGQTASYYTLGPDGHLVSAEISREFQADHALLERRGVLDHPFGARDEGEMLPVLEWDGTAFRPLPGVAVTR